MPKEATPKDVTPQEIERKFLVDMKRLPAGWESSEAKKIVQGYVAIEPGGTEVRLRRKGQRYFLTVKSSGSLERSEGEIELEPKRFSELWPFTEGRRVEKVRYSIPLGDQLVELDVYEGALEGLATAEVEFATPEASRGFEPPPWFGEEKTEDAGFKNRNLAVHGLPV